jgi:hypothetical protein
MKAQGELQFLDWERQEVDKQLHRSYLTGALQSFGFTGRKGKQCL